jgi:hypothetical protein
MTVIQSSGRSFRPDPARKPWGVFNASGQLLSVIMTEDANDAIKLFLAWPDDIEMKEAEAAGVSVREIDLTCSRSPGVSLMKAWPSA